MTAAIPGHGFEAWVVVRPRCKCGWRGQKIEGADGEAQARARADFERHKAAVRAISSNVVSTPIRTATVTNVPGIERHLEVVR